MEDLVNYAVKIAHYAVVLEQMTRKNWSITWKNSKLCRCLNNYKTVPKEIFSHRNSCFYEYYINRPFVSEAAHFMMK